MQDACPTMESGPTAVIQSAAALTNLITVNCGSRNTDSLGLASATKNQEEWTMIDDPPSTQLDELKTLLFPYVMIGPLLSAFFAQQIDNIFVVCALFVLLVGSAFYWFKKRIDLLEKSILDQERRLVELTGGTKEPHTTKDPICHKPRQGS